MEYIHYGNTKYDPDLFCPIRNSFVKPTGGMWTSAVGAGYGWKDWNESSQFRECDEANSFRFTLREDANVLHIYNVDDLAELPRNEEYKGFSSSYLLDFEKLLEQGVDAIELHLSEEKEHECMEGLYWKLYGWDCDSILIMNKDIIQMIESEVA